MAMTKQELIKVLPAYKGKVKLITDEQDIYDIIKEVQNAHQYFAADYDLIAPFFWTGNASTTCEKIFNFLKSNIRYKAESENEQTTKSPSAILTEAVGDCKHYAGFTAGVLDAINRLYDVGIKWSYRFASYDPYNESPCHVFCVANDDEGELWIDPVLSTFDEHREPTFYKDKKVKVEQKKIAGINDALYDYGYPDQPMAAIGNIIKYEDTYNYSHSTDPIVPKTVGNDPFFGTDFLGLSRYGNLGNTDLNKLTAQLQSVINEHPYEKYTLSADRVKTVIRDNMQHWNFYYSLGTSKTPRSWKAKLAPWVMFTITPDGRLTFDRDVDPDVGDPRIHYLTDWLNYVVQFASDEPYIANIDQLKLLGSGWRTPDQGSLWHVLHKGDKVFRTVIAIAKKIPFLDYFLGLYGLSIDTIDKFVTGALDKEHGGINTSIPDSGTAAPDGAATPYDPNNPGGTGVLTGSSGKNLLLLGGVGLAAWVLLRKKRRTSSINGMNKDDKKLLWFALLAGGVTWYLLKKKGVDSGDNPGDGGLIPTDNVIIDNGRQILPMENVDAIQVTEVIPLPVESDDPIYIKPKPVPIEVKATTIDYTGTGGGSGGGEYTDPFGITKNFDQMNQYN